MSRGTKRYHPDSARGTIGMITAVPIALRKNPTRMMPAGRLEPARFPASIATANMLSDSGASERPASMALYSRVIWRKIGKAIINPPNVICCIICWDTPRRKWGSLNRSGSSRAGWPRCLRRTSHLARPPRAAAPTSMMPRTDSAPSCQARMPRTIPPMPTTDSRAPTRSICRGPV